MASYLPSLMQTNTLDYENLSIKSDRYNPITVEVDHDSEISKWLKLENDPLPLPPIGNSSSTFSNIFSLPTVGGHVNNTSSTTNNGYLTNASSASTSTSMVSNQNLGNVNMNNHNNHVQASSTVNDSLFNYLAPSSSVPTSPPMTQHNSNRSSSSDLQHENTQFQFNTQNPFTNSTTESINDLTLEPFSGFSSFSNASNNFSSYSCNNSNTNNNNSINNGNTGISNESSQYSNFNYSPQYSNFNSFSTTPCTTNSTTSTTSSSKQFNNTQQSGYNVQQKNSNASKQSQSNQFNQNQFQFAPNAIPDLHSLATPQLYQLFAQFQQIIKNQTQSPSSASSLPNSHSSSPVNCDHDTNDDKKNKKSVRAPIRRVRQTRPKVVEAKGAVQCKGKNRKKGIQCRNAALMEYIGPRPIYCAEHIELDPKSLYEKCKSSYQKEVGDNKGCKEVVLKEFGVCYKHYTDLIVDLVAKKDVDTVKFHHERIAELLNQLEREASAAKKKDGDLYQRKNKLIPKFQEMKKTINKAVETLEINIHEYSPSHYSPHYHSHTHSLDSSPAQHLPMSSVQEHFMDVSRGKETGDIAPMNPDAHIHSYLDIDVDSPQGLLVLSDHGSDNDTDDSERDIVDVFTDVSDD